MNPLLQESKLAFDAINFTEIKNEHFLPAVQESIHIAKSRIHQYKLMNETPTFQNTIEFMENVELELVHVTGIFFNLLSAESSDELQKLAEEISPLVKNFYNDLTLDPELFKRIKYLYDNQSTLNLSDIQTVLLHKMYRDYIRNGALLSDEDKKTFRKIDEELSQLSLKFGENLLKATNQYELVIDDEKKLKGIPETSLEAARELAEKKGHKGKWQFSLHSPSYGPVISYAQNRELRETMAKAAATRCFGGEFDNREIVVEMANLRLRRAKLLGYQSHAHYVLEERMAQTVESVNKLTHSFLPVAFKKAKENIEELKQLQKSMDPGIKFEKWDVAYYSEILQKIQFDIDDEVLRPYFKLENVVDGVFQVAKKLYGVDFKEVKSIPKYHEEVKVYEVIDNKDVISLFYVDFFPREGKRGGAWMTSYRDHFVNNGKKHIPHISIVCNFTKSTASKPSLLTLDEVRTLFHEFGHALHGIFSKVNYRTISGTSVFWDFVELPSQVMENWVLEKECLDLFAVHYQTGDKIPDVLIDKIKKADIFLSGMMTLRQLSLGILDLHWHSIETETDLTVQEVEEKALGHLRLLNDIPNSSISCTFSHIFDGGYSAGYYSYKWAEVLDADAFDYFKENGIFNQEVARSFREHILEKGGSEHPSVLYKKFRGKEPSPDSLFKRSGLM